MQDDLGGPNRVLSEDNVEQEVYEYDEFGVEMINSHNQGQGQNQTSINFMQPFTYTGYQKDNVANTYYAQARENQAGVGRFVSKDIDKYIKMHQSITLNQYIYCNNNSLMFIDPTGFVSEEKAKQLIIDNADNIVKASNEFGVDPVLVAGCIYQEQVQNVDWKDSITDVFGASIGLDTSVGVGQVKMSTAKLLEEEGYMPSLQPTKIEIKSGQYEQTKRLGVLQRDETNIRYVAAYLAYQSDQWRNEFPDIDNRIDILASLYNLGHEQRGEGMLGYVFGIGNKPRNINNNPQSNEFGEDVLQSYDMLATILGIEEIGCND